MRHSLPAQWLEIEFPKPGSNSYSPNEFRIYSFHLANLFNKTGLKLVTDYTPTRQTKDIGSTFIDGILDINQGGFQAITSKGANGVMILLYVDGALQVTLESPEDEYQRPKLTEQVAISCTYGGTLEFVNNITRYILENSHQPESSGNVYAMITGQSGPEFKSIGHGGETLIRENYSDSVLANYDRIADTLTAKIPPGRINIMSGPPGTGKTYLIRGLIQQVRKAKFAIIQASSVASLANPGMLPALLDFRNDRQPIVFIIEDAEECLATRDMGNNSAVSALLNMGDGVLGSLIDLRIVATTNTAVKDLDPAIRRPGRLSTICEVGPLSISEAAVVYHRLTGKEVFPGSNPAYTIAEIYQMATDAGWKGEAVKNKRMGFGAHDVSGDPIERIRILMEE